MTSRKEWSFGAHRAYLEEPDVLVVRFEGPTSLDDARAALEVYREVCSQRPRYLFADIGRSSIDGAVRKFLASEIRSEWFCGVVYVGANLAVRVMTKALSVMVLFNAKAPYEVSFVADEAEGRACLEAWRRKAAA